MKKVVQLLMVEVDGQSSLVSDRLPASFGTADWLSVFQLLGMLFWHRSSTQKGPKSPFFGLRWLKKHQSNQMLDTDLPKNGRFWQVVSELLAAVAWFACWGHTFRWFLLGNQAVKTEPQDFLLQRRIISQRYLAVGTLPCTPLAVHIPH